MYKSLTVKSFIEMHALAFFFVIVFSLIVTPHLIRTNYIDYTVIDTSLVLCFVFHVPLVSSVFFLR